MQQILEDSIALTGFSMKDAEVLQESAPTTQKWVEAVISEFYDTLYGYDATASVFTEDERPAREETLRNWYLEVTSGKIDDKFWQRQWFVGLIHIKRKVSNVFVLGMVSRIQQLFLNQCMEEFEADKAKEVYGAFKRVFDIVAALIAESYFTQYIDSLQNVLGFQKSLIGRMMELEVDKRIATARKEL